MQQYPNKITIEGNAEADISATAFDVDISIRGTSLISGAEAYRKAKEYVALQSALISVGVLEEVGLVDVGLVEERIAALALKIN